jgi:hypothetical protein
MEHYKEQYLILPSFISVILWSISYYAFVKVISSITGKGMFDSISGIMFNTSNLGESILKLIFFIVIILIITLLLQSIILLTVNVNYTIIYNKLRYLIKNKLKFLKSKLKNSNDNVSDSINIETTDMEKTVKKYKLTFVNAIVCSLFIFSLLFFLSILFFWIGTLIGNKLI